MLAVSSEWIKIKDQYPVGDILYLEGDATCIAFVQVDGKIWPAGPYCNKRKNPNDPYDKTKCSYIDDYCGCDLKVNLEAYWMPLPDRLKP